mgnify:CR=1 FL=1
MTKLSSLLTAAALALPFCAQADVHAYVGLPLTAPQEQTAPKEQTAPQQAAPQQDTSSGTDTSTTATCDNGQQVAGQTVMTRWGPVQVAATIANGQLCEVHAVVWPTGDGRSVQINNYAIPQLDSMASQ